MFVILCNYVEYYTVGFHNYYSLVEHILKDRTGVIFWFLLCIHLAELIKKGGDAKCTPCNLLVCAGWIFYEVKDDEQNHEPKFL